MTIEDKLERIATALETIAAAGPTKVAAAAVTTAPPANEAEPAPKKRGRPAKVEKVVEEVAEETADEPATDAGFLDDEPADEPVLTREDVKAALVGAQSRLTAKYNDAQKGLAEAMAILKKYGGVVRLSEIGDDQAVFKKVIDAAKAAK